MAKVKAIKEGLDVLGGLVKNAEEIAKKLVASGMPEEQALNQSIKLAAEVEKATAADRAAAGRKAAAQIKQTPVVKASEALGQAMEKGFKKTTTTQSDRTRVGGGNIGGAAFPAISEADPRYAGKVWGVMDTGTASRLANLTAPDVAWSTMLGSATQLKTNPVVFAKLEKQFKEALKAGKLSPDLESRINSNLGLFLGEGADFRDPNIWKALDTFEKRASMADLMMGQGLPPKKGGVALGGEKSGKGVIFNPTGTLIDETEVGLLHPEHGGYVPTFAVGPRLFSLTGEKSYRPDLHPGFPTLLEGKDLGVNMRPTPTEVYLPDWHARFKANNPDRKGPGYYDLALGVKGEGLPSQDLNDEYIRHLIREGYAEGGEVRMGKGGALKKGLAAVEEYVDPVVKRIGDWFWRPMADVRANVKATEVPEYVQKNYGEFMADQAKRAAAGDLNARDLIKAYGITRSSVNRGGLSHSTATKMGMKLPKTTELVRPEGAFAEWLGSKAGQKFLDDAQAGQINEIALSDLQNRFSPFGMPAVLAEDLRWATRNLPQKGATISADVLADPEVYREVSQQMRGIGPAKSGFMASMIGRGDFPTFDARQIRLHTGEGGSAASKYMRRGEGEGGEEAVARLAARQRALDMGIDPSLDPFYQHLVHHTIWDEIGDKGKPSQTTHEDIVKAMRGYAEGGAAKADFFVDPSSLATTKSKEMYPKQKSEWTEQDAARHMLAAGMMAQKFGPTTAKVAGLAHEHLNSPVKTLGYMLGIGKMPADYEQDLHNNALGIEYAQKAANQEELERMIKEATGKASKTKTKGSPWIGEPKNAARLSDY